MICPYAGAWIGIYPIVIIRADTQVGPYECYYIKQDQGHFTL
jgi:hypothetical protein